MGLGTAGLGEAGLARSGVGLGSAGLEAGVAAPPGIVVGEGVAFGQTAVAGDMVFDLPAHNNGDLLALAHYIARTDDLTDLLLVTTPGWVELDAAERRVFSGTAMTQRVWTKFGDGVETQVTVNNGFAGGAGFALACVAISGVDAAIFDVTPLTAHSKLQNNSSNPTAIALTTTVDGAVMLLFCGHGRTFTTYAPPTGYADNANNSFNPATVYACSKKVDVAGLEAPGPWNTTGVNAGADNLLMSLTLLPGAGPGPDISAFSFDSDATLTGSVNLSSLENVFVTQDGLHLYCTKGALSNSVFQFSMSPAHDISSLAFVKEDDADGQNPRGISVREDGSQLFVLFRNPTNPDGIFRWPLSPNFDIAHNGPRTTLVVEPPGSNQPTGMHLTADGTKVYIVDVTGDEVLEFTLSTPYDLTTGTHTGTLDVSLEVAGVFGVTLSVGGRRAYVLDANNDEVEQYNLSIPFDIDSAVHSGVTPLAVAQGNGVNSRDIHLTDNDTKLYVVYVSSVVVELYTI